MDRASELASPPAEGAQPRHTEPALLPRPFLPGAHTEHQYPLEAKLSAPPSLPGLPPPPTWISFPGLKDSLLTLPHSFIAKQQPSGGSLERHEMLDIKTVMQTNLGNSELAAWNSLLWDLELSCTSMLRASPARK